jgi:hypothetical protein
VERHLGVEGEVEHGSVPTHGLQAVGLGGRPGEHPGIVLEIKVVLPHPAGEPFDGERTIAQTSHERMRQLGVPDVSDMQE